MKLGMLMQVGVMIYTMKCSNKAIWLELYKTTDHSATLGNKENCAYWDIVMKGQQGIPLGPRMKFLAMDCSNTSMVKAAVKK